MNYNKKHPELKKGEVFLMNLSPDETLQDSHHVSFLESRRLGEVAYDSSGNIVKGWKPMFGKLADCYERT